MRQTGEFLFGFFLFPVTLLILTFIIKRVWQLEHHILDKGHTGFELNELCLKATTGLIWSPDNSLRANVADIRHKPDGQIYKQS